MIRLNAYLLVISMLFLLISPSAYAQPIDLPVLDTALGNTTYQSVYAYRDALYATTYLGFDIFDASNPDQLIRSGSNSEYGYLRFIQVVDQILVGTLNAAVVVFYDVEDPYQPHSVATFDPQFIIRGIYVSGTTMVLLDDRIHIYDISDLNDIRLLSVYTISGNDSMLQNPLIYGNYLYVGRYRFLQDDLIYVFDITNRENPELVDTFDLERGKWIRVFDTIYVIYDEIRIYHVDNNGYLNLVNEVDVDNRNAYMTINNIYYTETTLLVSLMLDWNFEVSFMSYVYDISDISHPEYKSALGSDITTANSNSRSRNLFVVDNNIIIDYRIAIDWELELVDEYPNIGGFGAKDIDGYGQYSLAINNQNELNIVDVTNPNDIQIIGDEVSIGISTYYKNFGVYGDVAFVLSNSSDHYGYYSKFTMLNLTNMPDVSILYSYNSWDDGGYPYNSMHFGDGFMVRAIFGKTISISDIRNPPSLPSQYYGDYWESGYLNVSASDEYVFVKYDNEYELLRVYDPPNYEYIGRFAIDHQIRDFAASGDMLLITTDAGFEIFDHSDPYSPTLMASIPDHGAAFAGPVLQQGIAYVNTQNDGLVVYQIDENTFERTYLGRSDACGSKFYVDDGLILSANGTHMTVIDGRVVMNPVAIAQDRATLSGLFTLQPSYPNPFNGTVHVAFDLGQRMDVTLQVFSILGQQVAAFDPLNLQVGRHEIAVDASTWSSGTYFLQVAGSTGHTYQQKITLIK